VGAPARYRGSATGVRALSFVRVVSRVVTPEH
jgi:hypothetical protein